MRAKVGKYLIPVLSWSSFVLAAVGGSLAPGMWLGQAIAAAAVAVGWLAPIAFFVLLALLIRDLGMDGEPNRIAVIAAMVLPTLAASTPGDIGAWVTDRCRVLVELASQPLAGALGSGSATVLTVTLLAVAVVFAQRAVKSGRKSKKTALV